MGNSKYPLVSVIMAVYNENINDLYLSIQSILEQSYSNLEFIIVNDNPRNKEIASIINSFIDNRIKFITNSKNIGLTKTLNKAINLTNGIYIARMDADDISDKDRLKKQVLFLETNPDIYILGTWAKIIDCNNKVIKKEINATDSKLIKINCLLQVPFLHPTVIFRKEVFSKYGFWYNENFLYAQDFELWTRLVHHFKTSNLPEFLLYYRRSTDQISLKKKYQQTEYFLDAIQNQLESFNISVTEERRKLIKRITRNHDNLPIHRNDLVLLIKLINDLYVFNKKSGNFHSVKLRGFLRQKYLDCFQNFQGSFYDYTFIYLKMELRIFKSISILGFLKLAKRFFLNSKRKRANK